MAKNGEIWADLDIFRATFTLRGLEGTFIDLFHYLLAGQVANGPNKTPSKPQVQRTSATGSTFCSILYSYYFWRQKWAKIGIFDDFFHMTRLVGQVMGSELLLSACDTYAG